MNHFPFIYAGLVIVAAMTVGGGTGQGLWTDNLLQILMLPALFLGLARLNDSRFDMAARALVVLILAVLLIQFIPVYRPAHSVDGLMPDLAGWRIVAPAPGKAVESALFFVSVLGFAVLVSRFSDEDQRRCLRFLLIGLLINMVAAIIQLSYGTAATIEAGMFPFDIKVGLFANENHFTSAIFMTIPLIAWISLVWVRRPALYLAVTAAIIFLLLAVGSRAGMAISCGLTVICLIWFWPKRTPAIAIVGLALVTALILAMLASSHFFGAGTGDNQRVAMYLTTIRAISDHWFAGAGLGSFTHVYPDFEARRDIVGTVANHAHNDYLEIMLEVGILGLILIVCYFALLMRHFRRNRLAEAAMLSIVALSIHSLVDYPLRTLALAVPFGFLSALILSSLPHRSQRSATSNKPGGNHPAGEADDWTYPVSARDRISGKLQETDAMQTDNPATGYSHMDESRFHRSSQSGRDFGGTAPNVTGQAPDANDASSQGTELNFGAQLQLLLREERHRAPHRGRHLSDAFEFRGNTQAANRHELGLNVLILSTTGRSSKSNRENGRPQIIDGLPGPRTDGAPGKIRKFRE